MKMYREKVLNTIIILIVLIYLIGYGLSSIIDVKWIVFTLILVLGVTSLGIRIYSWSPQNRFNEANGK